MEGLLDQPQSQTPSLVPKPVLHPSQMAIPVDLRNRQLVQTPKHPMLSGVLDYYHWHQGLAKPADLDEQRSTEFASPRPPRVSKYLSEGAR